MSAHTERYYVLFAIILDIAILATMVGIAFFTKTAWGLLLIIALQKPENKPLDK